MLAALTAQVPTAAEVVGLVREVRLNGAAVSLDRIEYDRAATMFGPTGDVLFIRGAVMIDVHDTSQTNRTTGIQRVVRETVGRWTSHAEVLPVAWTHDHRSLRLLTAVELDQLRGRHVDASIADTEPHTIVVPLGGRFVIPELAAEPWRVLLHRSIAEHSGIAVAAIGYDLVPVTSSETSHAGIIANFPRYLDTLAHAERVAAISRAAAIEYEGWRQMLSGSGRIGPEIVAIPLAAEMIGQTASVTAPEILEDSTERASVLVVGSHEPRKNHLAVLDAARGLWDSGLEFELCFIGGSSWASGEFEQTVEDLKRLERPITVLSAVGDAELSKAYERAAFTMFPSLNEGFGLPIAESLAHGTPVITSNYGSMKEIADDSGGCLLVDPRDDDQIRAAMRSLLTDGALLAELRRAARTARTKTWDEYAAEVYDYLVRGA
ncbi:hypothetical protein ASG80_04350 [Agromyces sp. Soil535]|nr:hypothetical protein ASG80_04350 [Agromyces sp. Soil535]